MRVNVGMRRLLALLPLLADLAFTDIILVKEREHMLGIHVGLLDMPFSGSLLNLIVQHSLSLLTGKLKRMLDDIVSELVFKQLDKGYISRSFGRRNWHRCNAFQD